MFVFPKADIKKRCWDSRFVPKATFVASFNYLVGSHKHGLWHREAKRFRGLEVDH
jgi:hypothetical protein